MSEPITYKELKISTFELQYIKELKIEGEINEHTTLNLVGVLPEDKGDEDIYTKCNTPIKVYALKDDETKDLYYGIITEIKIKKNAEYFELHLKAKSYTYLMDIGKKKKSFQDKSLSLYDLVQGITGVYHRGSCSFNLEDVNTDKLWLQYDETDFEFIKRIASYYNAGIFPHCSLEGTHYYLGTPHEKTKDLEAYEYTVTKTMTDYNKLKENDSLDCYEDEFINYKVKSYDILELGNCVNFKSQLLYVSKFTYEIKESILNNTYELKSEMAQSICRKYNEKLQGISLEGSVVGVSEDKVQVKLDIDANNEQSNYCWFKYSTIAASPSGSGWYFMPEVNDRARVYFPTAEEDEAFALSCIHNINADPSTQYITTIDGNKIVFSSGGITLSANDSSSITLSSGGGISISGGSISVNASESISLRAEDSAVVSAMDNVEISCDKGGKVTLDAGGNVILNGTKVKIN